MLRNVTTLLLVAAAGCATEPGAGAEFERLPALALSSEAAADLPPCGDTMPRTGDVLVRLDDGSQTVVLLRGGEPTCAEDLATWLGLKPVEPTDEGPGSEERSSEAPGADDDDEPPGKDEITGPRPIPWMDGDGDGDDDLDDE
jgi:hypothetical protein